MKKISLILLSCFTFLCTSSQQQKKNFLIIGTYTTENKDGIYVYSFDTETSGSKFVSSIKCPNPSFLTISPNKKFIYSVNEDTKGMVTSYSFDQQTGKLLQKNQQSSHGKGPCYIAIDKSGKWIFTGNYGSGTLAVYPVNKDGSIAPATDSIEHIGSSVVSGRQESAHVHATVLSPDNKTLYVPDLGMDKVMMYSFNNKKGKLTPHKYEFVMTEPGTGPRHLDIHPNGKYAYLMEELSGSISVYAIEKDGSLYLIQNISGLPRDFNGLVGSADIHVSPDGKFLYCSNRGESNTIGILRINKENGMLVWEDAQPTLGLKPRNFNFDPTGKYLLVANQDSNEIVIFERDLDTGLLNDTGKRIEVSKPVCLKWITVN